MSVPRTKLTWSLRRGPRRPSPTARNRRRPCLEELEPYVLLSGNTFTVTSATDDGTGHTMGTLSWAIDQVDGDSGDSTSSPDTIAFDVNGGGAQTIKLPANPPRVTKPAIINGDTQPGFAGTPLVRMDGSSVTDGLDGPCLLSGASGSTIEGLDITGVSVGSDGGYAIQISANDCLVVGNDLGLTTAGVAAPNGSGIYISGSDNTVGGTTAAARNVISGNSVAGIFVSGYDLTTTDNVIEGNLIGTDTTGATAVPNEYGIGLLDAVGTQIGGTAAGATNVISGNSRFGISINGNNLGGGNSTGSIVEGNLIGTDAAGTKALGNGFEGDLFIEQEATDNTIGGAGAAANTIAGSSGNGVTIEFDAPGNVVEGNFIGTDANGDAGLGNDGDGVMVSKSPNNTIGGSVGNVIADNQGDGVSVGYSASDTGSIKDAILRNSIYGTTGLGIDLGEEGVIPNGSDGTTGPNDFQAFPVITAATFSPTSTTISGTLDSTPSTMFTIQFFASTTADPSGYGQGQTYLGQWTVMTSPSGSATFEATVNAAPAGQEVITATATDPNGNTSEFSRALTTPSLVVTNTKDSGPGSLRAAIQYADTLTGLQTITFDIPGAGVQTIQPLTSLPNITTPVILNGESQTGYSGTPLIRIDGSATASTPGYEFEGLQLLAGASGSTIEGLDITGFSGSGNGYGIVIQANDIQVIGDDVGLTTAGVAAPNGTGLSLTGSSNTVGGTAAADRDVISGNSGFGIFVSGYDSDTTDNLIEGDDIGTNKSGTAAVPNLLGIGISNATGNTIGGTAAGASNVISGNAHSGVYIDGNDTFGGPTTGNVVEGDLIGTDAAGTAPLGNGYLGGVFFELEASGDTIGGPGAAGNTIAGNVGPGVEITGSSDNAVEGNFIGTDANGDAGLGNGEGGVLMAQAYGNTIGGAVGNVIADNQGDGVDVGNYDGDTTSVGDAILSNSIYGNAGLGIDLGNQGVIPNDSDDHSGPNLFQDFPVITGAQDISGGGSLITGTVEGPASTIITVQLFANLSADPSGYGQGRIFLGSVAVPIGAGGSDSFSFSTLTTLPVGDVITATATDDNGNTSEFSADLTSVQAAFMIVIQTKTAQTGFSVNRKTHQYSQTFTVTNTTGSTIAGPIYLELADLTSGVTVASPTPMPTGGDYPPAGSPAVLVSSSGLGNNQSVSITLVFNDPNGAVISYTAIVLSDPNLSSTDDATSIGIAGSLTSGTTVGESIGISATDAHDDTSVSPEDRAHVPAGEGATIMLVSNNPIGVVTDDIPEVPRRRRFL